MLSPTWPEISLFLAAVSISLFLFARRIAPVVLTILRSPKDPGFQLRPTRKRVLDFIWEVLLQGKVIKERPLPGIAHALVFWGFCAFAVVTANHFAAGLGLALLSRDSAFGHFYFGMAALFAFAVLASILGLAFRRFVVKPKWLGPVSMESGIIAALIATLMITYLAAFWLPERRLAAAVYL